MRIKVRLSSTLARYVADASPGVTFEVELSEGATLVNLMNQLRLPLDEVKVAFVNGRTQHPDVTLRDGDEVGIFPPIGGG
jgi:molybdopterin converting factor small subunit